MAPQILTSTLTVGVWSLYSQGNSVRCQLKKRLNGALGRNLKFRHKAESLHLLAWRGLQEVIWRIEFRFLILQRQHYYSSFAIRLTGRPGLSSGQGQDFSLLHSFQTGSGVNHWLSGAISKDVTQQGREAGNSLQSSAEVKNFGAIPPLRHICRISCH
jgi:hypothetical protein